MRWWGKLLFGAGLAGVTSLLVRDRDAAARAVVAGASLAFPWLIDGLYHQTHGPEAVLLFVSDTHGGPGSERALVAKLQAEDAVDAFLHGGDIVDGELGAEGWAVRWDAAFRAVPGPWYAASGNHDVETAEGLAAFHARFGRLPRAVRVGSVDVFLLPWNHGAGSAAWLAERVQAGGARWRVLVTHRPLWSVKEGGSDDAASIERLRPALSKIDLVLSGHEHVRAVLEREVDGHRIRQVVEVSGPKHYACGTSPECVSGESGYTRIVAYEDELRLDRVVAE